MDEKNKQKENVEEKRKNIFRRLGDWFLRKKNAFFRTVQERTKDVKHAKAKRIALGIVAIVVVIFFIVFYLTIGRMIAGFIQDSEAFKNWMDSFNPVVAVLVYLSLRVLQTAFKLFPGGALEIAAGFIFGVWEGFLWSMVGSILGSLLILLLGKKYGMRLVGLFVDPDKMHEALNGKNKKGKGVTFFLMYFLPWWPKDIFTWVASVTDDNLLSFFAITTLARIPSVFVSAWCGSAIVSQDYALAFTILGVLIVFGVGGNMIYKAIKKKKEKAKRALEEKTETSAEDTGEKTETDVKN